MRIAITGATGFLGRYLVTHLTQGGHTCRCWYRPTSVRSGLSAPGPQLEWVIGELGNETASRTLVTNCDVVVHAALYRHGVHFSGGEGDVVSFVRTNVVGTLQLIETARAAGVPRFIFISTCAVHDIILDDRPLDETHPLWPKSHYGAHKAAIEKFVHAYGLGEGYDICALRPTGIYGLAHPAENSRWFGLVRGVARGEDVTCRGGGKEVHALDVARAVEILLTADGIAGQAYNCYDRYVSEYDVAALAKKLTGSSSRIRGAPGRPKHQIVTDKLRALGMEFGGQAFLEGTIKQMLAAISDQ
jgi:nucleoside-diphosphate-sugar epimerase